MLSSLALHLCIGCSGPRAMPHEPRCAKTETAVPSSRPISDEETRPAWERAQQRLDAMPEFKIQVLNEIRGALVEVKPLIDVRNQKISPESVKKINEITTRLDYSIVTKE